MKLTIKKRDRVRTREVEHLMVIVADPIEFDKHVLQIEKSLRVREGDYEVCFQIYPHVVTVSAVKYEGVGHCGKVEVTCRFGGKGGKERRLIMKETLKKVTDLARILRIVWRMEEEADG